jgi:hypothetical protein
MQRGSAVNKRGCGGNGTERKARQTGSFSFHRGQGSSATAVYIQPGFQSFALPATSAQRRTTAAPHTVQGGAADLATHQGDPQHKGSPRSRLLSLRRRGRSCGHKCLRHTVGEGKQRVRQTGATAYLLICDTGVPVPLLEVCDVSVIRFARRQDTRTLTALTGGGCGSDRRYKTAALIPIHVRVES